MTETLFPTPVLVLGVGNILMRDEGFGVRTVEALQKRNDIPIGVELLDGGTAGHDLIDVIENRKKIIVVDCVRGGCEPGSIYCFGPDDVCEQGNYNMTSLHQVGILEIFALSQAFGSPPQEVIIFGVEPFSTDLHMGLSPLIEDKMPKVIEMVMQELQKSI